MRALALIVLVWALAACQPSTSAAPGSSPGAAASAPTVAAQVADVVGDAAQEAQRAVTAPVAGAQLDIAQAAVPAIIAVREAVAETMTEVLPPPADVRVPVSSPVSPAAVALIVRHEIISPAYYTKALQGFACPGDRSGPTAGIGSDLGVQTRVAIRDVWSVHPEVDRLATGSGVVGFTACRAYRRSNIDIRTPFVMAQHVFATKLLPTYYDIAASAFRNGWNDLPPNAQGALVATVYVRGASMRDPPGLHQREEMRQLRDVCVPAGDTACMAVQFLAMCQRFEGRKDAAGLCNRFHDTARLAVQA